MLRDVPRVLFRKASPVVSSFPISPAIESTRSLANLVLSLSRDSNTVIIWGRLGLPPLRESLSY